MNDLHPSPSDVAPTASSGASAEAVQHHYDVGNEFYRILLGPSLVYSCASWAEGDTLERAQARKIDRLAGLAGVGAGMQVLDVGCGWGTALERLVDVHGVARAVGLTLSEEQAAWIGARRHPQVEVRIQDWADFEPEVPLDAAISIGAFEHFARPGLPRRVKVDGYRRFFAAVHAGLRPGAGFGLQTMAVGNGRLGPEDIGTLRFLARHVFPQSNLPRLGDIVQACDGLFEIRSLANDREDYAVTCRAWLENLEAGRAAAEGCVGVELVDQYARYLAGVAPMFERGQVLLLRLSLGRLDAASRG